MNNDIDLESLKKAMNASLEKAASRATLSSEDGTDIDYDIRKALVHAISSYIMMTSRGYSSDRSIYPVEWDADRDDSQFSMVIEDVEIVLECLETLGYNI